MAKIKKSILYKFGLPLGVAGAVISPIASLVSCGVTNEDPAVSWQFPSHNVIQETEVTDDGVSLLENEQTHFQTPTSSAPSSNNDSIASIVSGMTLAPFRSVLKSFDENKFDSNGKVVQIVPKRETALRFEMVDGVTFEFKDGSSATFDNDTDADYKDKDGKDHYSINGDYLKSQLKKGGLKNIRFKMRDDLSSHHWIQQLTGEKLSTIKADDLWRGALINLFGYGLNRSDSMAIPLVPNKNNSNDFTVNLIDQTFLANFPSSLKNAINTGTVTDGRGIWIDPTYGLDGQALIKSLVDDNEKAKFLPINSNEFVLPFVDNINISGTDAESLWNSTFVKAQNLTAISDTETKKIMEKKDQIIKNELISAKVKQSDIDKLINSTAYKSGYYQFQHAFRSEHSVAGKYYFATSTTKLMIAKWNQDYVDDRWLNQKNKDGKSTIVQEFRVKYIQKSEASNAILANEYKNGTSAAAAWGSFSVDQQIEILRDLKKWGINFVRSFTSSTGIGDYGSFSPFPFLPGNGNIYFNNNFSKLLFGDAISNYEKQSNPTPIENLWEYQMSGNGLQFRTNFAALFNGTGWWKSIPNQSTTIGWPTIFAPEGTLGQDGNGNDVLLTDSYVSPETAYSSLGKVMSYNVANINSNGSIENHSLSFNGYLDNSAGADINALGPSHNPDDTLPLKPNSNAHYSPFEWVQKNIKESIDKIVGPLKMDSSGNPIVDKDNELIFEMPYGRGTTSADYNAVYNQFQQYLRTVDPRLHVVAAMNPTNEEGLNDDKHISDASILVDKWTSDFDATSTPAQGKPNYSFIKRLVAGGLGYNFSSIKLAFSYQTDSPASLMFDNSGYLQSGILLTLSYLSNHIDDLVKQNDILKPLEDVIEFFKEQFNQGKTDMTSNLSSQLHSSHKQEILDALNDPNYTFENLYKSSPEEIAKYDYGGFYGLDKLWPLYQIDGDDSLTLDLNNAQAAAGNFTTSIGTKFNSFGKFNSYTLDQKLSLMQTWETLFGQNFSMFSVKIGDRRILQLALKKTWYTYDVLDKYSHVDISRNRVDLDRKDPTNVYSDVELVSTDQNGKLIVY